MEYKFKLGIQSYCLKEITNFLNIAKILKKVEINYLEIYPGHLSYKDSKEKKDLVFDILNENNIKVNSYGVEFFSSNENNNRKIMEFAKFYDIKTISSMIMDQNAIKLIDRLCNEYDIKLAIHNHGFEHPYASINEIKNLFLETSKNIGLCLDTAHLIEVNDDPLEAIKIFKDRLYGIHLKEFDYDKKGNLIIKSDGTPKDTIIGKGKLDLVSFLKLLKDQSFDGFMSLEFEYIDELEDHISKVMENIKEFNKTGMHLI